MNDIYLTLDLNKKPSNQRVVISKGDMRAPVLNVYVADNGTTLNYADLTDFTKRLKIRNPSGGHITVENPSVSSDGHLSFAMRPKYIGAAPGETFGYVELSKADQKLSTARFAVTILDEAEV